MTETKILINPFKLLDIIDFKGSQKINEHGWITFSGHISQDKEDECLSLGMQENLVVQVMVFNELNKREIFFSGILTELQIKVENNLKLLSATIKTGSYLMDLNPHIRSFQSSGISYEDILNTLNKGYQNASVSMNVGKGKKIEGLVLQYKETDWEFAKRLASRFNTVLIPSGQSGYPYYDLGICKNRVSKEIESKTYTLSNSMSCLRDGENIGIKYRFKENMLHYIYRTREIYRLGSHIVLNHQPLYVSAVDTELKGGELYHTYCLSVEEGMQVYLFNNPVIAGISLPGKVAAVQKDSIQVSINQDENIGACGTRWFSYSTVYSSADGTGWYCMPEIGDAVRICLPSEQEEQAYAASSVHLPIASGSARSNPNFKSIMNKQGKEVLFTPTSLLLTNNAGMSIELSDQEGIKIISDKKIEIKSDACVDISSTSDTLNVTASDAVTLNQGGTQINLKDKLFFKGAQVRIE